jgi:hypothetical protein
MKLPEIYLGTNISKMQLPDVCEAWMTSPKAYNKNSLLVVKRLLTKDGDGYVLKLNVKNPFPTGYKPEINITEELDQTLASRYTQLIGILRWAVKIGRIDIYLKVSLLSQYQPNPCFRHLEAIYHIFTYLKKHPDMGWLAYDSKCPDIDEHIFHHNADCKEFYGDVDNELPPNMPELWG